MRKRSRRRCKKTTPRKGRRGGMRTLRRGRGRMTGYGGENGNKKTRRGRQVPAIV